MPTSEEFCLKWNDFQQNINTAFEALRKDVEFTDVTLACEDGNQVEAHKLVLAASSTKSCRITTFLGKFQFLNYLCLKKNQDFRLIKNIIELHYIFKNLKS